MQPFRARKSFAARVDDVPSSASDSGAREGFIAAIVHEQQVDGPAAHALVIGVGRYPFLKGGDGPLFGAHEGMGQLASAPVSARHFTDWLIRADGYSDPGRPLGSVRLLLSEKTDGGGPAIFKNASSGQESQVSGASLAEVTAAVEDWANELNTDERHLGIFFFAGHGVMVGMEQILLLSDFGDPTNLNTRRSAIRFNSFRNGMTRIAAREQCYFLDACRAYTPAFADAQGSRGEGMIDPDPTIRFSRFAAQPVFNATLEGASAYGRPGEPSLFTDALLKALKGGGTDNRHPPYDWRIEVGLLNDAIEFLVRRRALREGLGLLQIPSAQELLPLKLGSIPGKPLVPVALSCHPENATASARFAAADQELWKQGQPDPLITYGTYLFEAKFEDTTYADGKLELEVRPPFRTVEIQVGAAQP